MLQAGARVGKWTVLKNEGYGSWRCRCQCGRESFVSAQHLRKGTQGGCRFCRQPDLMGKKFGQFTVVGRLENLRWACQCSCGHTVPYAGCAVRGFIKDKKDRACQQCFLSRKKRDIQDIVTRVTAGEVLMSIGTRHRISRQRVLQIWNKFATPEQKAARKSALGQRFSIRKTAQNLEVSRYCVTHALRRLGVREASDEAIFQEIVQPTMPRCRVCGKPAPTFQNLTCSDACRRMWDKQRRQEIQDGQGGQKRFTKGGIPDMCRQATEGVSPGDQWVGFTQAVHITGLSTMQLTWIAYRGILARKVSDVSIHGPTGGPCYLYSLRHLRAIKKLLRERRAVYR